MVEIYGIVNSMTNNENYRIGTDVIRRFDGKQGTVRDLGARRTMDNQLTHVYVEWVGETDGWDLVAVRALVAG